MKKIIVVLAVTLFYFNAVAQKENRITIVKSRIDSLGISPDELSDKTPKIPGQWRAYWCTDKTIIMFAQKSATQKELFDFLFTKNNIDILLNIYGSPLYIIAIEFNQITGVHLRNGKVEKIDYIPASRDNYCYFNNTLYLKKATAQK